MLACENGHTATAELLIAKGAVVEAKDVVRQGLAGKVWEGTQRVKQPSWESGANLLEFVHTVKEEWSMMLISVYLCMYGLCKSS
jgi:hypothetical protein